jgi:hypothetical protein
MLKTLLNFGYLSEKKILHFIILNFIPMPNLNEEIVIYIEDSRLITYPES